MGTSCWTEEHLLAHAEGCPVDAESGERVGIVEGVRWSPEDDEPEALVVSALGSATTVEVSLADFEVHVLGEHLVVPDAVARLLRG